jgi:hypothetical protein
MASSVEALLENIRTANTNISNRLGRLDEHIHAIIQAGEEILRKIRSGGLNDLQITEIREKLEDLRVKTMRNINAKNGRIEEIERIFAELLAAVSPNGQQEEEEEEEEEEVLPTPATSPFEPANTLLTKDSVKLNLQAIPDVDRLPVSANNSGKIAHLKTITDGIDSLKTFLQQDLTNPINRGLLAYVDTYYTGKPPQTLVGAMVTKHKPILLYILSLANTTVPDFIAGIQVKIPIFDKSDISARKDILGLVIAEFPEGQKTQFEVVQTGIMAELEAAAQRGGYKSRCGCGIPARRTLRGGRRRKTKGATRKTKPATRKTMAKAKTRKSRR